MIDAPLAPPALVGLTAVAVLFDFLHGLHDAANPIATIVSTRVLRLLGRDAEADRQESLLSPVERGAAR
jgi:hypothetical protein